MTRGSTDRSDVTRLAPDLVPTGRGWRLLAARLLRLGGALILGLSFFFTQVTDAAGAETRSDTSSARLESEAPLPETPVPPPEVEPPPADPPEPAPEPIDPPDVEPAPEPTDPPDVEPAPSQPQEVEPAPTEPTDPPGEEPAPTEPTDPPGDEPAPTEPTDPPGEEPAPTEPTEPPQVEPAPTEPTDTVGAGDEHDPAPQTTATDSPMVPEDRASGSAEERTPSPRADDPTEPAHITRELGDRQPVAVSRRPSSPAREETKHQQPSRERSGPTRDPRPPVALELDTLFRPPMNHSRCDLSGVEGCADVVSASAASVIVIASPRIPTTVSVAVEFGKAGQGWAGAIVFNLWLRRQLRERRMSQRQLAHLSGVNHSTISRLLAGDRIPSLETATKLARALRVPNEDIAAELGFVTGRPAMPMQRVEAALRGDEDLDDADVRELMEEYIARRRRLSLKSVDSAPAVVGPPRKSGTDPPA